jgi:hypothetical protein
MKRRLFLLVFVLLLMPIGITAAGSSPNYVMHRFVAVGGGEADSANYSVVSVFGQPVTAVGRSAHHSVSGGFLFPLQGRTSSDTWLPVIFK